MHSSRAPGRTVAPFPFNLIVAVFSLPYKNASFCVHREESAGRGSEVIPEVWGFVSPFWRLEFEGGFYVLGKSAQLDTEGQENDNEGESGIYGEQKKNEEWEMKKQMKRKG